jgi:CMP-N-acetylneuraminic acid synthetase
MDIQLKQATHAWIFARGGSKGLPRKNLLPLDGKPLIARAVEIGHLSGLIDRVFVSTEDPAIADAAREAGAEVPFLRPADLATDQAPERLAWRHAIAWARAAGLPFEIMVSLPPTAPLRTVDEVDAGIQRFMQGDVQTVLAVSRSDRHPAFNMVQIESDGTATLGIRSAPHVSRRQDAQPMYDISTAFYVTQPEFVMTADSIWDGKVGVVEIPAEHAVDIDTQLDYQFAEFLLHRKAAGIR